MVPTYDELSFGLMRLVAAGLIVVHGQQPMTLIATERGMTLESVAAYSPNRSRAEALEQMASAFGALPYPAHELEDRSLGRLPNLTHREVDETTRAYASE